jgi:hypothetical protein
VNVLCNFLSEQNHFAGLVVLDRNYQSRTICVSMLERSTSIPHQYILNIALKYELVKLVNGHAHTIIVETQRSTSIISAFLLIRR